MLSSKDISKKNFEKGGMFGYKIDDVDSFLIDVAKTVKSLEDEKEELLRKLKVLADKVSDYRGQESNLSTAMLNAQKLNDSIIKDANAKANLIVDDAKAKSEKIEEDTKRLIKANEDIIKNIKFEVSEFRNELLTTYKSHIKLISELPAYIDEITDTSQEYPTTEPVDHDQSSKAVECDDDQMDTSSQPTNIQNDNFENDQKDLKSKFGPLKIN